MPKILNPEELKKKPPEEALKMMKDACDQGDEAACKMLDQSLFGGLMEEKEFEQATKSAKPETIKKYEKIQGGMIHQITTEGNEPAVWRLKSAGLWDEYKDMVLEGIKNNMPEMEKRLESLKKKRERAQEEGWEEKASELTDQIEETEKNLKRIRDIYQDEILEAEEPEIEKESEYVEETTEEMAEEYQEEERSSEEQKKIEEIHRLEGKVEELKKEIKEKKGE